ncbi:MAG: 4-alpha-glucanotransferase [Oscillospiraceae bacterium]|nr:4-alpha-glucanotransferase [Oscillospiraceae bacterium]
MLNTISIAKQRAGGILLPVFSLPSAHGIGSFGRAAYDFVDFLAAAGQRWWQVLPLGCTGCGDSPYQSVSAFAGSPLYIDLDLLAADGLLTAAEIAAADEDADAARVDYERLTDARGPLLRLAFARGRARDAAAVAAFAAENADWLPDFALYMALKEENGRRAWNAWPEDDLRLHESAAVARRAGALDSELDFYIYLQFLFFKQWSELKSYANRRGVRILGDLPIYVAMDSADVWARRSDFCLDAQGGPLEVAGVPPDYFSADGQLWGNPLYDWERQRRDGYAWWLRRLRFAGAMFDAVRIDHFRGFDSYWAVPASAATAREGRWREGPGLPFIEALRRELPDARLVAEDLGTLTDSVRALLRAAGYPGMKVLEFAFDPDGSSSYLPRALPENCLCYTGTHDNAPLAAWCSALDAAAEDFARRYLGIGEKEDLCAAVLQAGLASDAGLFIAQLQDWLGLGRQARINTPGTVGGNWVWRLSAGALSGALAERIARQTRAAGR